MPLYEASQVFCFDYTEQYTLMRFLDLTETSTDMAADWIFEKFKLI